MRGFNSMRPAQLTNSGDLALYVNHKIDFNEGDTTHPDMGDPVTRHIWKSQQWRNPLKTASLRLVTECLSVVLPGLGPKELDFEVIKGADYSLPALVQDVHIYHGGGHICVT